MESTGQEESFADSPTGWASRWTMEFASARKALEAWHNTGDIIDKEFRCEGKATSVGETRLSVFTADVQTMQAMLYGQTPKVSVARRFADAKDDVARVAGEMLERLLNSDIARDSDTYQQAIRYALTDRLLPGMGFCRVRYVAEFETADDLPEVLNEETGKAEKPQRKKSEDAETDYGHWKDQLWGPARVFTEIPWWAHKEQMKREKLVERFGEEIGNAIPLNSKRDDGAKDPWGRADVWEVWHKDTKRVFWYVEGYPTILDSKDDPLELDGFWPFPEPLFANLTTSKVVPRPDYALHQDQYTQITVLVTRIHELTDAVRVTGLYDETNPDIAQILTESARGKLVPVKNWHALSEKNGLAGAIDWFPVEQVVKAIAVLQERLSVVIDQLYQVSGKSDLMRGEATQAGATATEQRGKMRFGSVRIQRLQDEFARFASDIQRLRAQIIAKHFDVKTIIQRSNAEYAFEDPNIVRQAAELIKSGLSAYRIEVKPEAVALQDFSAVKQERSEVMEVLVKFIQAIQSMPPQALPYLLQMGQWLVSGLRGASQIEGTFDQMIQAAQQAAAQPPQGAPPDPKLQAAQIKAQGDLQKGQMDMEREKLKLQNALVLKQADVQAHAQQEETQRIQNVMEHQQKQIITNALKAPPEPPARPKQ